MLETTIRRAATGLSVARALFGVAMIVAPRRIGEAWIGEPGGYQRVGVLTRSLGARDVVLGVGAATALVSENGAATRLWLGGQALADLIDLAGTVSARDHLPQRGFRQTVVLAGASAVVAGAAAAVLD